MRGYPDAPPGVAPYGRTFAPHNRSGLNMASPGKRTAMQKIKDAASVFLANKRVAVTGVSRRAKDHGSNVGYKRLRDRGYEVYAVNPNADEVEGDRCYH